MSVKYKDYYKLLGVSRSASADEIKKSFRDLAKKYHPDRTKGDKKAEEKFKEINEAYEVLGDTERKKQYDMLGSNWQSGQDFTPPPEWEQMFNTRRGQGGTTFQFQTGGGGFSDFFDLLRGVGGFGGARGTGGSGFDDFFAQAGGGGFGAHETEPAHLESEVGISLEEAFRGTTKKVTLAFPMPGPHGHLRNSQKTYDIRIPPGIHDGQKIRLKGEGGKGGAGSGDLLLRIKIAPHPVYGFDGADLSADLKVAPWEAALGGKISVPTLEGKLELKLPAGVRSGQKLRLAGKGYPLKGGSGKGDLILRVMIQVPKTLTDEERKLFEKLQAASSFNPREG